MQCTPDLPGQGRQGLQSAACVHARLLCVARVPDHLMASDWSELGILPSDWLNLNNVSLVNVFDQKLASSKMIPVTPESFAKNQVQDI